MGCPAYTDNDVLHHSYIHTRGQEGGMRDVAGQLADTYGLKRHRHLTYGGGSGYQNDINYTAITALGQAQCAHFSAERHALSDLSGNNPNFDLEMDLMDIAGAAVKELKDTIEEMSAMGLELSPEQRADFVKVIFNTTQLIQLNKGRIELTTAQVEQLSLDTIEILDSLAKDMILPVSLKSVTTGLIRETATVYKLDSVLARLDRFEKETTPQALLEQSVAGLTATLQALLEQDDLEDTTREQIEELLEKLDSLEDGEPLPREIMKEIKALSEVLQDQMKAGSLSAKTAALIETLKQDTFKVSEANIAVKAEKFDLTIAQVRNIEKTMDRLEEIGEALPDESAELKDQIAEAIAALDQEPTSLKALAKLEAVTEALNSPEIGKLGLAIPALAAAVAPFKTEVVFVQKMQVDGVTKKHDTKPSFVRESSALYRALSAVKLSLSPITTNDRGVSRPSPIVSVKPEFIVHASPDAPDRKPETPTPQKPDRGIEVQGGDDFSLPDSPVIDQIDRVLERIEKSPESLLTVTEVKQLFESEAFRNILSNMPDGVDIIEPLRKFEDTTIEKIAQDLGVDPELLRQQIDEIIAPDPVRSEIEHVDEPPVVEDDLRKNPDINQKNDPSSATADGGEGPQKASEPEKYIAPPVVEIKIDTEMQAKLDDAFGPDVEPEGPEGDDADSPCRVCPSKGKCKTEHKKVAKGEPESLVSPEGNDPKTPNVEESVSATPKPKRSLGKKRPSMAPK